MHSLFCTPYNPNQVYQRFMLSHENTIKSHGHNMGTYYNSHPSLIIELNHLLYIIVCCIPSINVASSAHEYYNAPFKQSTRSHQSAIDRKFVIQRLWTRSSSNPTSSHYSCSMAHSPNSYNIEFHSSLQCNDTSLRASTWPNTMVWDHSCTIPWVPNKP